jgi:hypothetical protein
VPHQRNRNATHAQPQHSWREACGRLTGPHVASALHVWWRRAPSRWALDRYLFIWSRDRLGASASPARLRFDLQCALDWSSCRAVDADDSKLS